MSPLYIGAQNSTVKQLRPSGSRKVTHVDIDSTGVSSVVVTGIPTDAVRIVIAARNYSVDTGVYHRFSLQFGNGSFNTNNVYWYTSGYYRGSDHNTHSRASGSPTSYLSLIDTDHTGAAHVENGTVVCNRFTDSEGTSYAGWHVYAMFGDMDNSPGMQYTAQGFYGSANGAIDRLKIFNSGAGYDSGARIGVSYETGDWD